MKLNNEDNKIERQIQDKKKVTHMPKKDIDLNLGL